jgi:hypothetical protein
MAQKPVYTLADALRERALAFDNEDRVPRDLFSTQMELVRDLTAWEKFLNERLDNKASLEISVGKCFSPYARNDLHIPDAERQKYRHQLPDGRIVYAWAYPLRYLPDFRRWLRDVYFPVKFPAYQCYRDRRIGTPARREITAPRKTKRALQAAHAGQLLLF